MPPEREAERDRAIEERVQIKEQLKTLIGRLQDFRQNTKGLYDMHRVAGERMATMEAEIKFLNRLLANRGLITLGGGAGSGLVAGGGIWVFLEKILPLLGGG